MAAPRKRRRIVPKEMVYTIEYTCTPAEANLSEVLECLQQYGSAEVVKTEIVEEE